VDGCARAAIRSIEADDIRKDDSLRQLGGKFVELLVVFRDGMIFRASRADAQRPIMRGTMG
jgi:hypothetical protein